MPQTAKRTHIDKALFWIGLAGALAFTGRIFLLDHVTLRELLYGLFASSSGFCCAQFGREMPLHFKERRERENGNR